MRIAKFLEANRSVEGGRRERRYFVLPLEWGRRAAGRAVRPGSGRWMAAARTTDNPGLGSRWTSGTPLF